MPEAPAPLAKPADVADFLGVTENQLAQMRYLGTGPAFLKPSPKVVRYDWADVRAWLAARRFSQTA